MEELINWIENNIHRVNLEDFNYIFYTGFKKICITEAGEIVKKIKQRHITNS